MLVILTVILALLAATVSASPVDKRATVKVQIHPQGNECMCLTAATNYKNHASVTL